jgi:two-component system response regulator AtoC
VVGRAGGHLEIPHRSAAVEPAGLTSRLDLAALAADPGLAAALAGIERAAASDAPVLILGEPGSGRSTLARALHAAGPRGAGPLVEVDAGVIPAALFESELFGYRAGAFTGAERDSEGRVARAAGGTLVLDHVEELPLAVQPKLLRLLAERRYAPLGGAEVEAAARFVALGPGDLPARVAAGTFRADLYYRLEVLCFRLPPLRRRRAELPAIAHRLAADLAERFGRPAPALAPRALEWMAAHSWPGNLTELRAVLERALVLAAGSPADLAPMLDPPPPAGALLSDPPPRPLAAVEADAIRRALAHTRGHQGRAAALLGISRKALWQKRKRHGIP